MRRKRTSEYKSPMRFINGVPESAHRRQSSSMTIGDSVTRGRASGVELVFTCASSAASSSAYRFLSFSAKSSNGFFSSAVACFHAALKSYLSKQRKIGLHRATDRAHVKNTPHLATLTKRPSLIFASFGLSKVKPCRSITRKRTKRAKGKFHSCRL